MKDKVLEQNLEIHYIPSDDQIANGLTEVIASACSSLSHKQTWCGYTNLKFERGC